MGEKSLIYSFVSRGTVVLAEFTEFTGNFNSIALQCLQKLPASNNKFTYNCDGHTFNYLVNDGYTYCVVADESVGRQVPIAFLECIKDDFVSRYGRGKAATAPANSLNKEFGSNLKEHMQYCIDHPDEITKLAKVKAQVSEVIGVMIENIEKVFVFSSIGEPATISGVQQEGQMAEEMPNLPDGIICDILSRLSTKCLIRFRSVCKHWQNLISDPTFIKSHWNQSVGSKSSIIITRDKINLYSLNYDAHDDEEIVNLGNPFLPFFRGSGAKIRVMGSCNGLVLVDLSTKVHDERRGPNSTRDSVISFVWNPSTREYRRLPDLPFEFRENGVNTALVHDPRMGKYKVIRFFQYDFDNDQENHVYLLGVFIYTIGVDSWRRIEDSPWDVIISARYPATLMVGSPHWMGTTFDLARNVIVSFVVGDEVLRVFDIPNSVADIVTESECSFRLGVLEESLAFFHFAPAESLDIWLMKDYGISESWSKQFSISQVPVLQSYYIVSSPFECWRNGEILLLKRNDDVRTKMHLFYDSKNQSFRDFRVFNDLDWIIMGGSYVGSLASIEAEYALEGDKAD